MEMEKDDSDDENEEVAMDVSSMKTGHTLVMPKLLISRSNSANSGGL